MRSTALLMLALVLAGCGGNGDGETARMDCDVTPEGSSGPPEIEPLEEGKTHRLAVKTNKGSFTVELDLKSAPCTTASIADLAGKGFFDGTIFHRIVPGFVIQGGDPTGSGTGGPGYTTQDVPPRDAAYVQGTVAMAKSPAEPPGAGGSQFFIVTSPDTGLTPDYALVGKVVKGQRVVAAIGELGDPASGGSGVPLQPVVIEGAQVAKR